MKKTLLSFALASMFMAGAVQAADHSATVDINGTLTGDKIECNVTASVSSLTLQGRIEGLPIQGGNANNNASGIALVMNNGNCSDKVALQLHGQADDADGTTLANTDASATAAKGVGIGVFDNNLLPLDINTSQIPAPAHSSVIFLQMVKLNNQTPVEGTVHGSLTIDVVSL